jgi:hypothetical protein
MSDSRRSRWLRLRVRPGVALRAGERDYTEGEELVVSHADAAMLLRDRGTRAFDVVDDFEADSERPPDGVISLEP